jgi:regulator of nonsense transcripts 2
MDVKFEVQDVIEKVRPNAKIHESLEEAAEALNEIVAKQAKPMGATEMAEGSDGVSEKSDEEDERTRVDDEEPEEEDEKLDDMEVSFVTYISNIQVDMIEEPVEEEEDEDVVFLNRNVEPEVDEEFNREFARIMSESLESRKGTAAKGAFDVEPPSVRTRMQSNSSDNASTDPDRVQFSVLSRRNKHVHLSFSCAD